MEIVLARHGRPRLDQWVWISPHQLTDWLSEFAATGILKQDVPPLTLQTAALSQCIVSSPLPRCMESARAVSASRDVLIDPLFREAELPHANWKLPRLPVAVWALLFRIAWFCGYSSNSESLAAAEDRARIAAETLIDLAHRHQSVFAMGHGIMTALIAKQLILRGWTGPTRPSNRYWQFRVYRSPAAR